MAVSARLGAGVSDAWLVAAAQGGDAYAADALLRRYDPALLALVCALQLPNGVETHDVLQAARLGFAGAIATWRAGGAPFSAYARTCARRRAITAIDDARTGSRRILADAASLELLAQAGREPVSSHHADDPYRTLLAREQLNELVAALPTLSPRESQCLKGSLNGRAYLDLARSLGGTTKAVALAVRRARDKLAAAVELG